MIAALRRSSDVGGLVAPMALCGLLTAFTLAVTTRVPDPSALSTLALVGVLAVGGWMFLSERYALSLAVLCLYLGLLDGFLKMSTGHPVTTLGRDVLLYAIVGGALARITVRKSAMAPPPLTGWVLAFTLVVLVGALNPGSYPAVHAVGALRPHLEFVPLFFLGYVVMRDAGRLRMFLVLLLVCGAANGIVGVVQYNLTPRQLASWGPGYSQRLEGAGGVAGRTFAGANGESRVRPFGLAADVGGGGLIAVLAIPAGLALIGSAWRRPRHAALAVLLSLGVVAAIVTSQGRGVVLAAFVIVGAYAAISVSARRLVPTLAGIAVAGLITFVVISAVSNHSRGNDLSRYSSIAPGKVLTTTNKDRGGALSVVPKYIASYPLGYGLGTAGPATSFGGGRLSGLSGESEFSFLVLELGIAGLVIVVGFTIRLLVLARHCRVQDPELRMLLAAIVSPLFGVLALYIGGPATAGSPVSPYLWFVAGVMAWWLITARRGALTPSGRGPGALPAFITPEAGVASAQPLPAPARPSPAEASPLLAVAYGGQGEKTDAILAHSRRLVDAVHRRGTFAGALLTPTPRGRWALRGSGTVRFVDDDLVAAARHADGLILQYNPFSYGRWGVAPWLTRAMGRLDAHDVPLAINVHEAYVHPTRAREAAVGVWQRRQLTALLHHVDVAFASTEALVSTVQALAPGLGVHHLPVGSNVPDRRAARETMRACLRLAPDDLGLVAFGTGHPSQLTQWVGHAARTLVRDGRPPVVLNLGAGAPAIADLPPNVRVLTPGVLGETELAEWLSAGDVFVGPFSDGVSTRRGTVAAALQHGLAVVATDGPNTGPLLREARDALWLVEPPDLDELERAILTLAGDPEARRARGAAGRQLYEEHLAWGVIAQRLTEVLETAWLSDRGA
jgi:hypothetical protein